MSPKVKQILSSLGVAVLGGVLAALEHYAFKFGPEATLVATSVYGGIVHRIPALGTEQATVDKIAAGNVKL